MGIGNWFSKAETSKAVYSGTQTLGTAAAASLAVSSVAGVAAIREVTLQNLDATNAVMYWIDGTAPTTTVGFKLIAGAMVTVQGEDNVRNLKMIGAAGTPVVAYSLLV